MSIQISEEHYKQAVNAIRQTGSGSVSNLQRHLNWGYACAAACVERMQDEYIVSEMSTQGRREVYPEELHGLWQENQQLKQELTGLKNPWVKFDKPELSPSNNSDCLTSKEVFFELAHNRGTYHGWYIARPVDKSDQYFHEDESENDDVEYEYFFNANVGDELFDEDYVVRWMYVPNEEVIALDQDGKNG